VATFGAELINGLGAATALNDPSLEPSIASWLSGKDLMEAQANPAVKDLSERELDELIARLLVTIDSAEGGPQSLELVAGDLELLEPRHSGALRTAVTRAKIVAQWTEAIAAKRRLVLSGNRGDITAHDPRLYEGDQEFTPSAKVRIKIPAVLRQHPGRPNELVLKGEVSTI
jgi:hypothetical protein